MFRMKGIVPPMITPFYENGEVDYESLKELTKFLRDKVDGLFITGSYGGGPLMSIDERSKVVKTVIDSIDGHADAIVHVGSTNTRDSVILTKRAIEAGADAVSAVGPYYFHHNDDSVCEFYSKLVEATEGKVPVYVYNNLKFQGYEMSVDLIKRLKEDVGVGGIKDATFDIMSHANYQRLFADENFDIALGTEAMWLSASVLGCDAFIPGLANAFPEICRKMYLEGANGDYEACKETQFKVNELRDIMYLASSTQLAVYTMLELRGIIKAYPRSPFLSASEEEKQAIKERLIELKMI